MLAKCQRTVPVSPCAADEPGGPPASFHLRLAAPALLGRFSTPVRPPVLVAGTPYPMYARTCTFIRVWILGDLVVDVIFQTSPVVPLLPCQPRLLPQCPAAARSLAVGSGHVHVPAPHTVSGLRVGGLSARRVGRALRHLGRTAGCVADHGPCPSADQLPVGCRWLLGPVGRLLAGQEGMLNVTVTLCLFLSGR